MDKAMLDLLLRCRDDRMVKPPAQVHGDQSNDLQCLARAGRLFDEGIPSGSPADICKELYLIRSQLIRRWFHVHVGAKEWSNLERIRLLYKYTEDCQ